MNSLVIPQLRRHPHLLPPHPRFLQPPGDPRADLLLVPVSGRAVDVSVAGLESESDGGGGVVLFEVPGAVAEGGWGGEEGGGGGGEGGLGWESEGVGEGEEAKMREEDGESHCGSLGWFEESRMGL